MAFQTGTTGIGSIEELVQTLFTFATGLTGPGWIQDDYDTVNNRASIHRVDADTVRNPTTYINLRWGDSPDQFLGIGHSTGFTLGLSPHNQPGDDGAISTTASNLSSVSNRSVHFQTPGPFTRYYFYASETAPFYVHAVVESEGGKFRHFGFGQIDKFNDWSGGNYVYGDVWDQSTADIDNPASRDHAVCFWGNCDTSNRGAGLHCPAFDGQIPAQVWAADFDAVGNAGNDRAGNTRLSIRSGGVGGGLLPYAFGWIRVNPLDGFKPLQPLELYLQVDQSPDDLLYYAGVAPDIRSLNIGNLNPGDELTIGADTWQVFPTKRKQYLENNTEESWNQGIAYKKVT